MEHVKYIENDYFLQFENCSWSVFRRTLVRLCKKKMS